MGTLLALLRICLDWIPRLWRWIKPEPLTVRQCLVFVPIAGAIFYGGIVFSKHSAQEKLLVSQGEREEQEKKFDQDRRQREMKLAQEQEDRIQKFFFATPTPEDPAKVAKERAAANAMGQYMDAERESQQYDVPPGSDDTIWERQTYTDWRGVIWQRKTFTDSDGVKRDRFVPQLPKQRL
jgi:hypothetical protein